MATIWDPKKNEQQQAAEPGQTSAPTSQVALGTSGSAPKPQGSGQFTNLQSYIRANQGTEAGQQAGAKVLGAADSAMNDANTATNSLKNTTIGSAPQLMDNLDRTWLEDKSRPQAPQPQASEADLGSLANSGGGIIGSGGVSTISNAANQQTQADKDRFNQLFTKYGQGPGSYSGAKPAEIDASANAAKSANLNAASQSSVLKGDNAALRAQYLRENVAKQPDYSYGQNKLDSFLLERNFGSQFDPKFQQNAAAIQARQQDINDTQDYLKFQTANKEEQFATEKDKWARLLSGAAANLGTQEQQAAALSGVSGTINQNAATSAAQQAAKQAAAEQQIKAQQDEQAAIQTALEDRKKREAALQAEMNRTRSRSVNSKGF